MRYALNCTDCSDARCTQLEEPRKSIAFAIKRNPEITPYDLAIELSIPQEVMDSLLETLIDEGLLREIDNVL